MLATLLAFAMLIYIAVRRPQAAPAPRVEEEEEDDLSDDLIALPDPISEPGGHRVEPGGHRGPTPLAPMSGAFFDDSWEESEAATEVAVMPSSGAASPFLPPPPPKEVLEADEQATEVLDAEQSALISAALGSPYDDLDIAPADDAATVVEPVEEPAAGTFFDQWDDSEAPTALMTDDIADQFAEMLLLEDEDEDN